MPLPANNTAWPPAQLEHITPTLAKHDAWYVGDPDRLAAVYGNSASASRVDRPAQYRGGVAGAVSRFFWGRPIGDLNRPTPPRIHVPLAADIARASSDLCWSEAPAFEVENKETQKRLDELTDDGLLETLAEGNEIGAALGGQYVRVSWDTTMRPDAPFLTLVDADAAHPEFRYGMLAAVTFWWVVERDGSKITRHLERHELDSAGVGVIAHGLYVGDLTSLGNAVPLVEHRSTAALADIVDDQSTISTESPGLAVAYIPNLTPNRAWRNDPIGRHLGRSDLDGVEQLMDALDETWTSWMRDIRLGKARVFVARSLLESGGPGGGAALDIDAEIYSPLNALASNTDGSLPITPQQFAIRYEEHASTATELTLAILRTAGYSPSTFGLRDENTAATATEVNAREQRSLLTRSRKLRIIRPRLADILEKLLAVDAALFGSSVDVERPTVSFPDGVQDSVLTVATTVQALYTAQAASTHTLVQMVHPEWDDQAVEDEVALILAERDVAPLPDPTDPNLIDGASTDLQT